MSDEEKLMPKKRSTQEAFSQSKLHVVELTRAGSSVDLEIYADNEKIGTMIIGRVRWFGLEGSASSESESPGAVSRR